MLARVRLHPQALKHMQKGHPWVSSDHLSNLYPKDQFFLIGPDQNAKDAFLLLHDPLHRHIKARVWAKKENWPKDLNLNQLAQVEKWFQQELQERLKVSISRRDPLMLPDERQNFYLVFGEADHLPGLFIQRFAGQILVQTYANFWDKWQKVIAQVIEGEFPGLGLWWQNRSIQKKSPAVSINSHTLSPITVEEFGIKYAVSFNSSYDQGLYTDMASVRSRLRPLIKPESRVLNLFSYTGAFSLLCMAKEAQSVVSVDLSKRYLQWLEDNLTLNPKLKVESHTSLCKPVEKALVELNADQQKFDLIVCDPPSASSDGKKTTMALKAYELFFPMLATLLAPKGKMLLCLNTHKVTKKKFEQEIVKLTKMGPYKMAIKHSWSLEADCPRSAYFPEGDYLKCLMLENLEEN